MNKLITIPRLIIFGLLILVLIMCAWVYLRNVLANNLVANITSLESQNYQIGHDGLKVSGFPFIVDAKLGDASVRGPISNTSDLVKNWSVKSGDIRVYSSTFTPLSWQFEHRGKMRIDLRGYSGERFTFDVVPATIDGQVSFSIAGGLKSAQIDIAQAKFKPLANTAPIISQFEKIFADIDVLNNIGRVNISGANIALSEDIPKILANIVGDNLTAIELNTKIDNWALLEVNGIETWLTADSRLSSDYLALKWGLVDIVGDFDITFKNRLPEGIIHIRIKEPEQLLQNLIANQLVREPYIDMAKMLIAVYPTQPDGRKYFEITIKDGVVKTGIIPIYKF